VRKGVALTAAVLLLVAGCETGGSGSREGSGTATATTVATRLQEWAVVVETTSAPPGPVTFEVTNAGEDVHELVVLRTGRAPDSLPTSEDGAVIEDAEGVEVVGEVEDIEPGASADLTVDLEGGTYVLVCNIVHSEDHGGHGGVEVHYALGMRTGFNVAA